MKKIFKLKIVKKLKRRLKKDKKFYYQAAILILVFFISFLSMRSPDIGREYNLQVSTPAAMPTIKENIFTLKIPVIKVEAPIVADVDGQNQALYDQALENGVAHLKGTAKPGQGGNIFIFGHSAFYFWSPGHYKEIFKDLPKLKTGDEIDIEYNQKQFRYQVSSLKTVEPNEVDVLKATADEQVSLMTCVPPGTTKKRLIIVARPI